MKEEISHKGRILSITPELTTVEIISESACASCHASALCGMGESKKKIVEIPTTPGNWEVGQEVLVNLRKSMGMKAVWVAYVAPLIVLFAVLLILLGVGVSELAAGLASIGTIALYYLVVFLCRDRLKSEYVFYIK